MVVQSGTQAGSGGAARDPLRGDVLVVLAQLFAATQFIGELARHSSVDSVSSNARTSGLSAGTIAL